MITITRESNGYFKALKDGIDTGYRIINGDLGMSGQGRNMYGIYRTDPNVHKTHWIGSLAKTKKTLKLWLK